MNKVPKYKQEECLYSLWSAWINLRCPLQYHANLHFLSTLSEHKPFKTTNTAYSLVQDSADVQNSPMEIVQNPTCIHRSLVYLFKTLPNCRNRSWIIIVNLNTVQPDYPEKFRAEFDQTLPFLINLYNQHPPTREIFY